MREQSSSENIYKDIFESFLDLYLRCDLSGKIIMLSPSTKDITGYEIDEIIGKNITNYYLYNSRTKSLYKKLLIKNHIKNFEINLPSKSGKIIPCICNIRLLYTNGKPTGIECICRDVTKLVETKNDMMKAIEVAEQSLKVKDQFLANMSHEIRTPMNGIMGLMDLLEDSGLNEKQITYIHTMRHSSELLLNLMSNIINLTKVRTKKTKLSKDTIQIYELLKNMKLLFHMEAQKKNIPVSININKDVPYFIESDETRLLQILSNLLSNAIKFTNINGKVDMQVAVEKKLPNNQMMLSIAIIDNGIGIAKKYQNKLFQSFTQIESSYSKNYSGAGLGLSITKELVTLFSGDIRVESDYGKGSEFTFTFKTKETQPPTINPTIKKIFPSAKSISSKILLVDDNNTNRLVAKEILKKANHKVDTAIDGFEALKMIESTSYDIILMDIQLPELSGVDTMLKIKAILQEECPPIIAVTAFSSEEEKEKFLKKGFYDYLGKPFSATDIIRKVEYWQTKTYSKTTVINKGKSNQHQILNIDTINQLIIYSDFETINTSLIEFNKETKVAFKSFEKLLKNKEYDEIGGVIHNIKGNSGTLGGDKLFEHSRKIEQNIKKGNFSTLYDELKSLYLSFSAFKAEIKEKLNIALDE